jgi:regulator of protease activity HflC (stomatin/prohibitin superfamily)
MMPGFVGVAFILAFAAGLIAAIVFAAQRPPSPGVIIGIIAGWIVWLVCLFGFKINYPNSSLVMQLFGTYLGTLTDVGFFYGNPFLYGTRVSLRLRLFETDVDASDQVVNAAGQVIAPKSHSRKQLKINDKDGTPIEIAAVVVWRVLDPAQAVFDVDRYEEFVKMQSDAALRTMASRYSYDAPEADAHSLRSHIDEIATQLRSELQIRMQPAGVEVLESRISKLAYATEIAAAMLLRQQAGAVIAARSRIVEGAVGMVEHALDLLEQKNIVDLDPERKAAMVSNLLVVLCSHNATQPIINTGTLYN